MDIANESVTYATPVRRDALCRIRRTIRTLGVELTHYLPSFRARDQSTTLAGRQSRVTRWHLLVSRRKHDQDRWPKRREGDAKFIRIEPNGGVHVTSTCDDEVSDVT